MKKNSFSKRLGFFLEGEMLVLTIFLCSFTCWGAGHSNVRIINNTISHFKNESFYCTWLYMDKHNGSYVYGKDKFGHVGKDIYKDDGPVVLYPMPRGKGTYSNVNIELRYVKQDGTQAPIFLNVDNCVNGLEYNISTERKVEHKNSPHQLTVTNKRGEKTTIVASDKFFFGSLWNTVTFTVTGANLACYSMWYPKAKITDFPLYSQQDSEL